MKHAIIILTHNVTDNLINFISYFGDECDIFIHVDKKYCISKKELVRILLIHNVKRIYNNFYIHWGGYSILKCELFLIKKVITCNNYDFIHLFSGQDYPIRPYVNFLKFFEDNKDYNFIQYVRIPNKRWDNDTFSRFQYYYVFDYFKSRTSAQKINKIIRKWQNSFHLKRRIPDFFDFIYGGSQWFSIKKAAAKKVLDYTKNNPRFLKKMRFTFAPEEVYIQTVLINVCGKQSVMPFSMRYIRWKYENGNRPANLNEKHFHYLIENNSLFARKFENNLSDGLRILIDRFLLKDSESIGVLPTGGWIYNGYLKYGFNGVFVQLISILCSQLKIQSVVDMGCGDGIYVSALRNGGLMISGYDANPFVVELSKRLLPVGDEPCEVADLTDNLDIDEPFGLVICKDVIQYIPNHLVNKALDNLRAMTGRYLIINWSDVGNIDENGIHYNNKSETEVIGLFQKVGFIFNNELTIWTRAFLKEKNSNNYYLFNI